MDNEIFLNETEFNKLDLEYSYIYREFEAQVFNFFKDIEFNIRKNLILQPKEGFSSKYYKIGDYYKCGDLISSKTFNYHNEIISEHMKEFIYKENLTKYDITKLYLLYEYKLKKTKSKICDRSLDLKQNFVASYPSMEEVINELCFNCICLNLKKQLEPACKTNKAVSPSI